MMYAYNEMYLNDAMRNLGEAFDYAVNVSTGTKMPVISSDSILAYKVPYNRTIANKFNEIKFTEVIAKNIQENQILIALRNWLLPLLMNGQAKVVD